MAFSIPAQYVPQPITNPNARAPLVDEKGMLTSTGLRLLQNFHDLLNGISPIIPCNCSSNGLKYTLTPLDVAPNVPNYYAFWSFAFTADATSTGLVTATVVPNTGVLPTLIVVKPNGPQANAGDILINNQYIFTFSFNGAPYFTTR